MAGTEDSEFDDLDYNKVDKALKSVGINLKDVNGQFRNLDEVFLELGSKWNTLDRNSQRYVATIAAGSRQQSRFIALMQNYDRVNELIEVTKNATGRADEQFAKYADTVEYKTKQIQNNWEQFRTTLFQSEDYKKILNLVNQVLERVTKFKLPDVAAIGIWALTVGKTVATNIVESLQRTLNSSKTIISRHIERSILGTDTDLTDKEKKEIRKKAVDAEKTYQEAVKKASAAEGKIADTYGPRAQAEKDLDHAEYLDKTIENLEEQYQKRMPDAKTAMSFTGIDEVADGIKSVQERTKAERAELGSIEELKRKAIATQEEYNKAIDDEKKAREQAEEAAKRYESAQEERKKIAKAERWSGTVQALGQTVGNSLATAITMAFTGAFSGKEIAVTMNTQILGTAMPMFMSSITGAFAEAGKEGGKTFWESFRGSGGWVTFILTIATLIGTKLIPYIMDQIEESNEKTKRATNSVYNIQKQMEELEEVQEKYNQKLDEANQKYDEAKTKWDSIEDAKNTYEELSSKIILSEEETENLQSATATLADQCPELIDHYDSMGNAVLKIGSAFDEVIEKQQRLYQDAELEQRSAQLSASFTKLQEKDLEIQENKARLGQISTLASDWDYIVVNEHLGEKAVQKKYKIEKIINRIDSIGLGGQTEYTNLKPILKKYLEVNDEAKYLLIETINDIKNTNLEVDTSIEKIFENLEDNKSWRGVLPSFFEKIYNDTELYEQRIKELQKEQELYTIQEQALIAENKQYALDLAQSQLEYAGLLNQTNEEVQHALMQALSQSVLTDDKILQLQQEAQEEGGKDFEAVNALFRDKIANLISTQGAKLANIYSAATPQMQQILTDYYNTLGKVTETESRELINQMRLYNEDIADEMDISITNNREKAEEYVNQLASLFGQTKKIQTGTIVTDVPAAPSSLNLTTEAPVYEEAATEDFKNTALGKYFSDLGIESQAIFLENLAQMSDSDFQAAIFSQNFQNFVEDLSEEQKKIIPQLMSIDWNDISLLGLEEAKQSFVDWYTELDGTIDEAEAKWQEYYEIAKQAGLINFTSVYDTDTLVEDWDKKLSERVSAISGLKTAIQNQLEQGFIDFTDSSSVEKACEAFGLKVTDYISFDIAGNMILDIDKLENAALTAEDTSKVAYDNAIKELDAQIETLNYEIQIAEGKAKASNAELENQKAITDLVLIQAEALGLIDDSATLTDRYKKIQQLKPYESDLLVNALKEQKEGLEKQRENLVSNEESTLDYLSNKSKAATQQYIRDFDTTRKTTEEAVDSIADKLEDLEKAAETLEEKSESLNETLYGTSYHKSKNDGLYNYQTQIDDTSRAIDRLQDKLANLSEGDNSIDLTNSLLGEFKNQKANYLAENRVIDQYLDNQLAVLQTKLASALQKAYAESDYEFSINPMDYFTISDSGKLMYDYDKINAAQMSDDIKDYLEEIASDREKQINAREDNIDKITKLEQDAEKMRKDAINSQVSLEDEVTKVLEDKYKKQIDDVKNKYSAMKDADNEYVDALSEAIEKQRRLRDEENSWNDLANKERKLALMQRDTSGGNRAEIKSLENEVQEDREKLLDDTVDNIIDGLKEMYETQQEARDAEIEYMEAMLENANLVEAANQIINSWSSEGDAVAWFSANVEDFEKKSEAYKLKEEQNWKDLYNAASLYNTLVQNDIETALEVTEADIISVITNTAEHLTTEPTREMDEFTAKLTDDIKNAKKAYDEAYEDWEEKNKAYLEALRNTNNGSGGNKGSGNDEGAGSTSPSSSGDKTNNPLTKVKSDIQSQINKVMDYHTNKGGERTEYERGKGELKNTSLEKYWEKISGFSFTELIRRYNMGWLKGFSQHINGSVDKDKLKALFNSKGILAQYEENPAGTTIYFGNTRKTNLKAFKAGGLVDFTGPAWVDGTKSKPEAFLNPDDTERIGRAAKLLSELPFLNSNNWSSGDITTTNVGDTTIEIHINIENVSSDYDVDQAVERVKQDIVDAANYAGKNVILKKA